ncbi:MAG TPA: hypothetical protein VI141_01050, partial [Acidimicrobiia bacterium]
MTVTYLRVRPAEMLAEPTAVSRRREGTTVLEMAAATSAELAAANKAGLLLAATSIDGVETAGWVLAPEAALQLSPLPWRLTLVDEGSPETVLDALARTRARHLRTSRSGVRAA